MVPISRFLGHDGFVIPNRRLSMSDSKLAIQTDDSKIVDAELSASMTKAKGKRQSESLLFAKRLALRCFA
jgi:hypothetical protein